MKKIKFTIWVLCLGLLLVSCKKVDGGPQPENNQPESGQTAEAQEQEQEGAYTQQTPVENLDGLMKELRARHVDMKDVAGNLPENIGAKDGVAFFVSGGKYEIYEFDKPERLDKTKETGTITFDLGELGKVEQKAKVNGRFLLIYEAENVSLMDAFSQMKMKP